MAAPQVLLTDTIRIGKKGQITLPKKIRDQDRLEEDDELLVTRIPSGDIILRKRIMQSPEDMIIEAVKQFQPFDADKAWKEVLAERRQDR